MDVMVCQRIDGSINETSMKERVLKRICQLLWMEGGSREGHGIQRLPGS